MFKRPPAPSAELLAMTERALAAEAQVAAYHEAMEGFEARLANRACLISIIREGRFNKFNFARNNQLFQIKCMGTWDDDVDQWEKDLFE